MSDTLLTAWRHCREAIATASGRRDVTLVAVGKTRPAADIRTLEGFGQQDVGENYVQEALPKILACRDLRLTWHFIGPLQSNKCREVAMHFDWVQSVDRIKLVDLLARHRPADTRPLNVLIQVNIDGETSKSGCEPDDIPALAAAIAAEPRLRLRGLMAIPEPHPDAIARQRSFNLMRVQFEALASMHPGIDTLSIGMSDDYTDAIAAGATMVRIGSALFGARGPQT